jgi:hypothetical protein
MGKPSVKLSWPLRAIAWKRPPLEEKRALPPHLCLAWRREKGMSNTGVAA